MKAMATTKSRAVKDLLLLTSILLGSLLLLAIGGVAQLLVVAALFAYILDPLVTSLEMRGLSRTAATSVLFLVMGSLIFSLAYFLVPVLIEQVQSLQSGSTSQQASIAIERLDSMLKARLAFLGLREFSLNTAIQDFKVYVNQRIMDFLVKDSLSLIIEAVTIPFIMFFLIKDGRVMKKRLISMVPNRYFEFSLDLIYKMDRQLGNYMRGQFLDALIFGAMATLAMGILGVKFFLFIGVFAGLANLIPFVGPIAGVLPAIGVTMFDKGDGMQVVYVIITFVALKLIDDFVVQPLAVGKTVNLHPMFVAVAILVGGHLFGILGMLLAVPCAGFLKVVFEESVVTFRKYRFN